MIVASTAENAAAKTILKIFYATKTTLSNSHFTLNVVFKTRKHYIFQMAGYWNFKNFNFVSLPHKPRHQTKHRTTAILRRNNKLASEMCLLGFRLVLFLLSSIRFFFYFMQWIHINLLIFSINIFLEQCI